MADFIYKNISFVIEFSMKNTNMETELMLHKVRDTQLSNVIVRNFKT